MPSYDGLFNSGMIQNKMCATHISCSFEIQIASRNPPGPILLFFTQKRKWILRNFNAPGVEFRTLRAEISREMYFCVFNLYDLFFFDDRGG